MVITLDGTLYDAQVIEKINTILPFTESSGSRSGKNYVSHMLQDKLMYVAGDYVTYTQEEDKRDAHLFYLEQLGEWCTSAYSHPHVQAIYEYVKKGHLFKILWNAQYYMLQSRGYCVRNGIQSKMEINH